MNGRPGQRSFVGAPHNILRWMVVVVESCNGQWLCKWSDNYRDSVQWMDEEVGRGQWSPLSDWSPHYRLLSQLNSKTALFVPHPFNLVRTGHHVCACLPAHSCTSLLTEQYIDEVKNPLEGRVPKTTPPRIRSFLSVVLANGLISRTQPLPILSTLKDCPAQLKYQKRRP